MQQTNVLFLLMKIWEEIQVLTYTYINNLIIIFPIQHNSFRVTEINKNIPIYNMNILNRNRLSNKICLKF